MQKEIVTTVFPKTNEEKLIEFQGLIYELEEVLRKLDELRRCEVAEKEAALAERENMEKLAAVKIGDAYEVRAEQIKRDQERTAFNYYELSLGI